MREMTWDDFADGAGRTYAIEIDGGRVDMTLDRVEQSRDTGRAGGAFRLEFLGPLDPVLPQALYPLSGDGDPFMIFIVPVAREAGGIRYEAIFG